MPTEIKVVEEKKQWNEFIDAQMPHTFLQCWEWKLSQELMKNKTFSLGIYEEKKLIGVAFVYIIRAKRGSFLFCPHGPIIQGHWEENFKILFTYLKKLAKEEKLDFIRISPLEKKTSEMILFFKKCGFKDAPIHMHPELAWMLDISLSEEELLAGMKKRTRYSIVKAQKDGVEVVSTTDSRDIEKFYGIYRETAIRQGFVPFSKEYVKKEFEIFSAEGKIVLLFASQADEIIATAMIVYCNGSGFYHHGASTRNHTTIPASELLQWHAIREAKKRGCVLYNFWGIAPENSPNHPWIGLSRFKKGFGGFDEEYAHAQDYPLALKYWLNYVVETLRRVKRKY